MRSLGIGQFRLRNQLQEWLDLSTLKSIPISLLIMSRALMLSTAAVEEGGQKGAGATTAAEEVLKSSMSSLDQGKCWQSCSAHTELARANLAPECHSLQYLPFQC